MHAATRAAGIVAGVTLALGSLATTSATADPHDAEPCAGQQAKVDKATDALARVTAVFERQQQKVEDAKDDVAEADTARERRQAKRDVAAAKEDRAEAKVTKRAQQQRLAKAQARLDACEADQAEPEPETAG